MKDLTFAKYVRKEPDVLTKIQRNFVPTRQFYNNEALTLNWPDFIIRTFKFADNRYEIKNKRQELVTYRRRSIGDLWNLVHTRYPEVTIKELNFLAYYPNFYCFNAEKRVYTVSKYVPYGYFPDLQPTIKDEYGMTAEDWDILFKKFKR